MCLALQCCTLLLPMAVIVGQGYKHTSACSWAACHLLGSASLLTHVACCLMLLQENLTQEVATLKADNGELRAKLEESRQQLQSNEQMIRWLNQQVGLQSPTTVTFTAIFPPFRWRGAAVAVASNA